jgi:hypothetical protein
LRYPERQSRNEMWRDESLDTRVRYIGNELDENDRTHELLRREVAGVRKILLGLLLTGIGGLITGIATVISSKLGG